jgi:hypothetical protein
MMVVVTNESAAFSHTPSEIRATRAPLLSARRSRQLESEAEAVVIYESYYFLKYSEASPSLIWINAAAAGRA